MIRQQLFTADFGRIYALLSLVKSRNFHMESYIYFSVNTKTWWLKILSLYAPLLLLKADS